MILEIILASLSLAGFIGNTVILLYLKTKSSPKISEIDKQKDVQKEQKAHDRFLATRNENLKKVEEFIESYRHFPYETLRDYYLDKMSLLANWTRDSDYECPHTNYNEIFSNLIKIENAFAHVCEDFKED